MLVFEGEVATGAKQTWVACPAAAKVCIDVHGFCYHQRPSRYLGSGLPSGDMLAFKDHTTTGTMLIWATYNIN